jgi:hypothetical protein
MKYNYNDTSICIDNKDLSALSNILNEQPELLKEGYKGDRDTPLHYAAEFGNVEILKYLVNKGLDVNVSLKGRETPLYYAASKPDLENAKWLLDHGAFVDGLETSLITPMTSAVYKGNLEMVKLLVKHGANVNRMHIRLGKLPLDIAIEREYKDIEKFLKENGAKSHYISPDWVEEETEGEGILSYVSLTVGKILPVDVRADKRESPVVLKMASVNNKRNRLLFTFGLFSMTKPKTELFFVLPEYWNFYVTTAENQFPILFLSKMIKLVKGGFKLKEGLELLADDANFSDLKWPPDVAGLFVSDVKWKPEKGAEVDEEEEDIDGSEEDDVFLYTLVPMKKTKTGFAKQSLEKNRTAGWAKLCLNVGE